MDYLRHSTSQERESIGRGAKGLQGHKKMTACTCHHLPITFFALLIRFLSSDETRIYTIQTNAHSIWMGLGQ